MKERIRKVEKGMTEYPERLQKLPGMPKKLYVWGELPSPAKPTLAIVGARDCSAYGKNMAYEYARTLQRWGIQVVSGLARGIDGAAHEGALAGGGKTYGVLGCGVDICYPAQNRKLYEKMKEQGGILSEFEPGEQPLPYHFPMRNRIISGLADAVLVVEAREKSGALITADQALEQGKTVFALPGRVCDPLSVGCNRLIGQGAIPAWKPEVIPEEMHWGMEKEKNGVLTEEKKLIGLAREDKLVYSCLDLTPKPISRLQEETGYSAGFLMASLLRLCGAGLVQEVWKNHYIRGSVR